jgi:hypothetical protein
VRGFDWWFRDRDTGTITIAQFPNAPLWVFLATVAGRVVVTGGAARTILDWIAALSLGWWALDELLRGVNPWRRVLGLVVGTFVVVGLVR